ncbi:MAG: DUF799 family lipoprotein [Deltaproteobacteria bacterium]|nr:DUF799 family lipoprotein [Deltaproteobacteria bacterium]
MKGTRIIRWPFLVSTVVFFFGCAGGAQHSLAPDYKDRAPRSIAVLPILNETVSLKAPEMFRPILLNKVSLKGYEAPALAFIDGRLRDKEIREAGQVNTLTPQELGNLLGVDALLYAYVTEFSTTYLLAYGSMTVGARFELKDAKTGEKLWESAHQVKESKLGLDQRSLGDTVQFAAGQSYAPYAQKVVDVSFQTLPNGPRAASPPQAGCLMPGI